MEILLVCGERILCTRERVGGTGKHLERWGEGKVVRDTETGNVRPKVR